MEVQLVNGGNTPAADVTGWAAIDVVSEVISRDGPRPMPPGTNTSLISRRDLAKDAAMSYGMGRVLSPTELDGIMHGTLFLMIYGQTTYRDGFGGDRETTYCYFYQVRVDDVVSCPGYNRMK